MKARLFQILTIVLIVISPLRVLSKSVYYVTSEGAGYLDGTSWSNAATDIQEMIDKAHSGDEIWIARGTYYPPEGSSKDWSIVLKNGVSIYGGFAGNETSIDERNRIDSDNNGIVENWEYENTVMISGDLERNDEPESLVESSFVDNCYRIIDSENQIFSDETIIDGVTISGGHSFFVGSGAGIYLSENITLQNSIVQCSYSNDNAAGCINYGIIQQCYFYKNRCFRNGGGAENFGKIISCRFEANEACSGSAIYNHGIVSNTIVRNNSSGSAIYNFNSIDNCVIENNETNQEAGGIYNMGSVYYSTINNNRCSQGGGGVFNEGTLYHCSIFNNHAEGDGGGVENIGRIELCDIFNNAADLSGGGVANVGLILQSTICHNYASNSGGGVKNLNTIINSVVWNNESSDYPQIDNLVTNPKIIYCAIEGEVLANDNLYHNIHLASDNEGNETNQFYPCFLNPSDGAGVVAFDSVPDWSITAQSILINNGTMDIFGGNINADSAIYAIVGDTIDIGAHEYLGNQKDVILRAEQSFITKKYGDANFSLKFSITPANLPVKFYSDDETVASFVDRNVVSVHNPGNTRLWIQFEGDSIYLRKKVSVQITVEKADSVKLYVNPLAAGNRNGKSWENAITSLGTCFNVIQNYHKSEIWIATGVYRPDSSLWDNSSTTWVALNDSVKIYGGFAGTETAIDERERYDANSDGKIDAWEFRYPTVLSGDIYGNDNLNDWPNSLESSRDDNILTLISLGQSNNNQKCIIDGLTIRNAGAAINATKTQGGGILCNSPDIYIRNSVFCYNIAQNGAGAWVGRGHIEDCYFHHNFASNNGGGLYSQGTVANCNFSANTANKMAGGLYNEGGTITSCTFNGNMASRAGGIFNSGTLTNSTIQFNTASNYGGGVITNGGTLSTCSIFGNQAQTYAGGVYMSYGSGKNLLIFNNSSPKYGGIYCENGNIVYSDICNNYSSETFGGAFLSGSTITNTIFWGNKSSDTLSMDLFNSQLSYCALMVGNEDLTGCSNYILLDSTNNQATTSPHFINPSTFVGIPENDTDSLSLEEVNWALSARSICIDAGGNDLSSSYDYAGNTRPFNQIVDIGAYEYGSLNPFNQILYVKSEPAGTGDGSSWDNASSLLQEAINYQGVKQVWVAEGTYYPSQKISSGNNNRLKSFILKDGVNVYGGFEGKEENLSDRELSDKDQNGKIEPWEYTHETILSGDIDSLKDDYSIWPQTIDLTMDGNVCHVVYQSNDFEDITIVDGFTICGGNAENLFLEGSALTGKGNLYLRKCNIVHNHCYTEGAVFVSGSVLSDCNIAFNESEYYSAAGIYAQNCQISNCSINHNNSVEKNGGIHAINSTVANCTIANNAANENGGGCFERSIVTHCSIWGNYANEVIGGVYLISSELSNTSIFSNSVYRGCGGVRIDENSSMDSCRIFFNNIIGIGIQSAGVVNVGTVTNCLIFGNRAQSGYVAAGGIANYGKLYNSVVFNNEAYSTDMVYDGAGGLYNKGIVMNTTICNNKANMPGTNIVQYNTLYNSVVWGGDGISDAGLS